MLERSGWFDSTNHVHKQLIIMIVLPALRRDIEEFVQYWNSHYIRPTSGARCPPGRPDDLYEIPAMYGKQALFTGAFSACLNNQVLKTVFNH